LGEKEGYVLDINPSNIRAQRRKRWIDHSGKEVFDATNFFIADM